MSEAAPLLRGARVVLRQLVDADAPSLHCAHADPDVHHFWSGPAHADVEETRRYNAGTLAMRGARVWAITEDGSEALGRIALFVLRDGVGEIGLLLRRDAHGRGYAAEALRLVEDYGFATLGLHRIFADADPDNLPCIALFERAGFQREALLRGNWKTHLGIRDSVILAKLRAD
jgi:RimJ/RimL family protein N-acetyltransferase